MSKMKLNKKTMAYRSRFMKEFLNTAREDKATTQNCPVLNEKSGEGTLTCCVGTSATTWEMSFIHALNKKCKFAKWIMQPGRQFESLLKKLAKLHLDILDESENVVD